MVLTKRVNMTSDLPKSLTESKLRLETISNRYTTVWFKNRRAKCRQQVKQHQQAQQHNGAEKTGVGRGSSAKSKTNPTTTGSTTTKTPSAVTNNTTSSTASSPALSGVHHRDSPGTPYIKPLLSATPPIPSVYSSGTPTNTPIWSPAVIDSCIESRSLGSGGSSYAGGGVATTTANCYPAPHQNYNPYYSNMDYLGPSPISHSQLNPESGLDSSWVKREDSSSWFYNSTGWDRK